MNRTLTIAFLVLATAAQLAVPAMMAVEQEAALRWGRQIKVSIEPVDPSQPFMGRYVALRFRDLETGTVGKFSAGQKVYVELEEDGNGFAHARAIVETRPENRAYLPGHMRPDSYVNYMRVAYPFTRFYLREGAAPDVERQVAAHRRRTGAVSSDAKFNAYITIRVWKGTAALEQLYIDNLPVEEYLGGQAVAEAGNAPKP